MTLNISHVERSTSKRLNPFLYTIEVRHGDFEWTIRRRNHDFRRLHTALFLLRTFHGKKMAASAAASVIAGAQVRRRGNLDISCF